MEIVRIGLEKLRGHRLRANVMRAEVKAKLRRHVERTGRYEPLVVRECPEEAGAYEILNGHQRAEVLRELGYREAECVVWEADDGEAELLLATLNRLRGGDEPGRRAELLEQLGRRVCAGHDSPMDYLAYAVLGEDGERDTLPGVGDCIVWANRGGGKTQLGAAASLLECLFLPGCQVRILGGSEQQSQRMYEYLGEMLERGYAGQLMGRRGQRGCRFGNGSGVQVLAQSQRSVRGQHVQRLRCDEAELFDREVWQAAQFVTQSRSGIAGRLEVLSTMHRPYGLMHELIGGAAEKGVRVFRWCLWEVIEACRDRACSRCGLWEDCRGRAKSGDGYYAVEDALAQKRRSSGQAWRAEMLCQRPSCEEAVFPEFVPAVHVREAGYNPDWPLYRSLDFGFSNPLVCLFVQVDERENVYVIDEHLKSRATVAEQVRLIRGRYPQEAAATFCDPAGRQKREITGTSVVQELVALGMPVRWRASGVAEGIERIRSFLAPAAGPARLFVAPRCQQLIASFQALRYARLGNGALSESPEKDGVHDHVMDALRYFFVNRFGRRYEVRAKGY